ncbi:MAG: permease [Rhizobiales bacterium]|nr:permease [Hyphomicrobiales bacterium]MBO6700035.1 permease [Hyphomicrobiales bacterium]MBO6737800.1 permease [Hyphomicrobiales bacterium]MBO6913143.1 permease [Hyphomicrobiales bacterium]MBO6954187.1 permease [Hyphomicrobiales bacterium]
MTDLVLNVRSATAELAQRLWAKEKVWLVSAGLLMALLVVLPEQGVESARFTLQNLVDVAPFLVLSIAIAAYAGATGADGLIARAFTGSPALMILIAAAAGGLSPFCSCGVIPLIAALLAMGVPLSAVMAFWLASPVMDPSMFVLTTGVLGFEFAVAKTLAAIGLGLFGGFVVHGLAKTGGLTDPLREGVGNGGCGGAKVRTAKPVVWTFWQDEERISKFVREGIKTTLFLAKWLTLAFLLESLMLAWLPADLVAQSVGGTGIAPIAIATLVGVPAYLNGYAALPLVGGLMDQGMAPGAGLAFLVAGGVTSLPAAIAVWALVKRQVFALYLMIALSGSLTIGLLFQLWTTL